MSTVLGELVPLGQNSDALQDIPLASDDFDDFRPHGL